MIIYDGEKYACASCIRGHRSSTCRHTDRMLVKVRNRGRHASMDIRKVIMVDTDSQVTPEEGSPSCDKCYEDSKSECDKMNRQPILFLRTKKTQRAILADGNLKIIVENDATAEDESGKPHPPFKYISEKEFLRMHLVDEREPSCACKTRLKSKNNDEKVVPPSEPPKETSKKAFVSAQNDAAKSALPLASDPRQMVELLTHRGLYLSTQCSCEEDHCLCANCLLHRNEEELSTYIQRSGVPLTNLGEAQLSNPMLMAPGTCECTPEECECNGCPDHPGENISFNRLLLMGLLNAPLKRKTNIVYRGKLIPSQYWWDFLKLHIPLMGDSQVESLDIAGWFERILSIYEPQLTDANLNMEMSQSLFTL